MKLQDIVTEERLDDYIKRLTKTLRIKKLGSGYYSSVFQHPVYHNVVVKLCRKQDPKTIFYLREGAKNPGNPWFPKIVGIHKVTFHDEDLDPSFIEMDKHGDGLNYITHIIFMQKLRPVRRREYTEATRRIFATMPDTAFELPLPPWKPRAGAEYIKQRAEIKKRNKKEGRFLPPLDEIDSLTGMHADDWRKVAKLSADKHVRELAALLARIGADDIHDGNVMMRDDGHPVITDPVAS